MSSIFLPLISAIFSAIMGIYFGSFGLPRNGTGVRKGESVSNNMF